MKSTITKTQPTNAVGTSPFFAKGGGRFFGNSQSFFSASDSNIQRSSNSSIRSFASHKSASLVSPSSTVSSTSAKSSQPIIQRKCAECEKEELNRKEESEVGNTIVQSKWMISSNSDAHVINRQPVAVTPKVCGPNVSAQVEAVWNKIGADFRGWGPTDKLAASLYLISPFVPESGTNPRAGGGAAFLSGSWPEPFVSVLAEILNMIGDPRLISMISSTSHWQLNRDAFDTNGLFVLSAVWTLGIPGCGQPSCGGLSPSAGLPRGYSDPCEDPSLCAFSVQMGTSCWLSGTVNYGTYGIMMREANTWCGDQRTRLLGYLPMAILVGRGNPRGVLAYLRTKMDDKEIIAAFLKEVFSAASLVAFVGGYKLWDKENPRNALSWALATYYGGASGKAGGSNRPTCATTCTETGAVFSGWDYVWEPVKHR